MKRVRLWLLSLLLSVAGAASSAVVFTAPIDVGESFSGGIQFVQNATTDYDYGQFTTLPEGFGDAAFTFKVAVRAYQAGTIGDTESCPGCRENWGVEDETPYSAFDWWFYPNFLLDGHNNSSGRIDEGTFSLQVVASGYIRWTFGDGSAADARLGDLHAVQNTSGVNILDGEIHVIHCVRESDGGSGAVLRLYIDGSEQDTETSSIFTDMAATYWDGWTNYPAAQQGWFIGSEKQAGVGVLSDFPDFKGVIYEMAFYGDALSAGEIAADQGPVDAGHVDLLDYYAFPEGSGTSTASNGGDTMTLVNAQAGGFWP